MLFTKEFALDPGQVVHYLSFSQNFTLTAVLGAALAYIDESPLSLVWLQENAPNEPTIDHIDHRVIL